MEMDVLHASFFDRRKLEDWPLRLLLEELIFLGTTISGIFGLISCSSKVGTGFLGYSRFHELLL